MSGQKEEAGTGVAAVERALSIVSAFEAQAKTMTLAEISRQTRMYKSTVLRLLVSLERYGYVVRAGEGSYRLGPMAFRLGAAFDKAHKLSDYVAPILRSLVDKGTESASYHVRRDDESRMCLFRVDSDHATLDSIRGGDVLPLRRGAAGRLLLRCDRRPADEFLPDDEFLLVVSHGERDPACAGLAAPVFGPDDRLCGAISLSGPRERFTDAAVERMSVLLLDASLKLSRSLGGQGDPLEDRLRAARRRPPSGKKRKSQSVRPSGA